jgi:hypothetical protein
LPKQCNAVKFNSLQECNFVESIEHSTPDNGYKQQNQYTACKNLLKSNYFCVCVSACAPRTTAEKFVYIFHAVNNISKFNYLLAVRNHAEIKAIWYVALADRIAAICNFQSCFINALVFVSHFTPHLNIRQCVVK